LFLIISCADTEQDKKQYTESEQHRCANCGMYTEKFPKWEEIVETNTGEQWYFCGPRCLFKYVLEDSSRYNKIQNIKMKDYYTLKYTDGKTAWYVIGSDVLGPMGNELIPFQNKEDAQQFLSDHHGSEIVQFGQVDLPLIKKIAQKSEMH
jgi:nitrous oxide reductase accessory protein NosL